MAHDKLHTYADHSDQDQAVGTTDSPSFTALSVGTGELTCGSINRASGTLTLEIGGTAEISITSTASTLGGNLVIPDSGTIGSASDTDVMTISSTGVTTFSVFPVTPSAAPTTDYQIANKKYVDDNAGGGGDSYVDRGDPAGVDFVSANFTKDETWNDLDLSSIVPDGATAVEVWVGLYATSANSSFFLQENGNSNALNILPQECRSANQNYYLVGKVSCDSSRVIEYWASNVTWQFINFVVRGWYI